MLWCTTEINPIFVVYYSVGPHICCGVLQYRTRYLLCTAVSDRILVVVYYSIEPDICCSVLVTISDRIFLVYYSIGPGFIKSLQEYRSNKLVDRYEKSISQMVFWWGQCCSLICFVGFHSVSSVHCCLSLDCSFLIATLFITHIGVISHLHTDNMVNCFVIEVYDVSAIYGRTGQISR